MQVKILDRLQVSIMIFYPQKAKIFLNPVSIDKAIYLNKEEFFCSKTYHLLIFLQMKTVERVPQGRATENLNVRQSLHPHLDLIM